MKSVHGVWDLLAKICRLGVIERCIVPWIVAKYRCKMSEIRPDGTSQYILIIGDGVGVVWGGGG